MITNGVAKYIPMKTIVGYILDQYDKSQGDFDKVWILCFRGFADMGFDIMYEPKTVKIKLNGNGTATLPPDYILWTKIGIINESQEVTTLKVNRSLTKLRSNNPNRQSYLAADTPDVDFSNMIINPYFLNYYFGNWYTPIYGLGSGLIQYGQCVVDETNGVIILDSAYPFNDVLLEYISSPQADADYMVEMVVQEAIIAFVEWKLKLAPAEEYYNRKIEARRRLKPVRLQNINQVIREHEGYKLKA